MLSTEYNGSYLREAPYPREITYIYLSETKRQKQFALKTQCGPIGFVSCIMLRKSFYTVYVGTVFRANDTNILVKLD